MTTIIFDIIGVIVKTLKHGSKQCMEMLYSSIPDPSISFIEFYDRYKNFVVGNSDSKTFWSGIDGDTDTLEKNYLDTYTLLPHVHETLQCLQGNYKLLALSNHPGPWMRYITEKFQIENIFEKIYISGEIGVKKPQEASFNKVLEDNKIFASDCIFVDDQYKNLTVATRMGFKTIHVTTNENSGDHPVDGEIASLNELVSIIAQL